MTSKFGSSLFHLRLALLIVTFFLVASRSAWATRPPTEPFDRVWSDSSESFLSPPPYSISRLDLLHRDIGNYIGQFQLTCDFLVHMQEHNQNDPNFGGLHEGEGGQLWAIVETDNTQETIRVWSLYAAYFDDAELYRNNIEAAWVYCNRFPAWEESAPGEMYALHNSGWGLMAEMAYRQVYGRNQREYGLNCAQHIIDYTPEITPDMQDRLMPLVAGWAAGTLYLYGIFEDNSDYRQAALRIGTEVRNWIDANPNRLNNNEIWALCGGTAMWGVLNSLGKADSSSIADWAFQKLECMDVLAGRGQWNNSWNIWYSHAWHSAYSLIGIDDYLGNALFIVDSLIAQDGDRDGGIPATIGDGDSLDQSWVSAYTAWMGLWNNFDVLPDVDIAITRLIEPSIRRPWPINSSFNLFSFELEQRGSIEHVTTPIRFLFEQQDRIDSVFYIQVNGWQPNFAFRPNWPIQYSRPGNFRISIFSEHENDADRSNDTLTFNLGILPVGRVVATATNDYGARIGCQLIFKNLDFPDDLPPFILSLPNQSSTDLMIGNYRIDVIPDYPYPRSVIDNYVINANQDHNFDLVFSHPPVLLVDNGTDTTHHLYYSRSLEALQVPYYYWNSNAVGVLSDIDQFSAVIYFSGNRQSGTILNYDLSALTRFNNAGGNLFVTGQNITDEFADNPFLSDVLHARQLTPNIQRVQALGIENDEVLGGMNLLLLGNRGANNQTSPSGIEAVNRGIECAYYTDRGDTAAAVRWIEPSGGKGVFFAFGFEAISGMGGTTTRDSVLVSILRWFGVPLNVGDLRDFQNGLPSSWRIFSAYPNPFNNRLMINIEPDWLSRSREISIRNVNGRLVRKISISNFGMLSWDAMDEYGQEVSAGSYFITLDSNNSNYTSTSRVVLFK